MPTHRAAGGDRPDLLDPVAAHGDIPVVEADGWVAMAGDQADLVPEPEPVGGAVATGAVGLAAHQSRRTTPQRNFGYFSVFPLAFFVTTAARFGWLTVARDASRHARRRLVG